MLRRRPRIVLVTGGRRPAAPTTVYGPRRPTPRKGTLHAPHPGPARVVAGRRRPVRPRRRPAGRRADRRGVAEGEAEGRVRAGAVAPQLRRLPALAVGPGPALREVEQGRGPREGPGPAPG